MRGDILGLALVVVLPAIGLAQPGPQTDGPRQLPVTGPGSGVTMNVGLRRGSESLGANASSPTWEVTLSLSNFTERPINLGEILGVYETVAGSDDTVGLYIVRTGRGKNEGPRQLEVRYGLDWGVTVAAAQSTPWPWGAIPAGAPLSATNTFMLLLSAPWASGFAAGSFPTVNARSQYTLDEKVMAPVGPKAARDSVIVLAPRIVRLPPQPPIQPIFVFREVDGKLQQSANDDLAITASALAPVASDPTVPLWKRIIALSLLSDSDFASARMLLTRIAEDSQAPLKLRASAMLNLGVNHDAQSVEIMKRLSASENLRLKMVALETLGETADAAGAPVIRAAIGSPDAALNRVAIRNAAKLKDAEAVVPIVAALGASRDEGVIGLCVEALAEIGTPQAWETVIATAVNTKTPFQARRRAIITVGDHAYGPGEAALVSLLTARGAETSIQLNVLSALEHFKDDAAVAAVVSIADAKEKTVGRAAVGTLTKINTPPAIDALVTIARTAGHQQSGEAIQKLGTSKNASAVAPLKSVLADARRSGADRAAAFSALKAIGGAQITADDRSALWAAFAATHEERASEQLARALIEDSFNDRSVIPTLIAGLDERRNAGWFGNVLLLRHLTGQKIGPEYSFGKREAHEADFARWRAWAAQNTQQ